LSKKNVKLLRPTLVQYIVTREELETVANAVWEFMEKDKFKADIYKVYPLQDAAQAQIDLEGRITTGKLLLKP
jgi:NADPH2:quinone reductase